MRHIKLFEDFVPINDKLELPVNGVKLDAVKYAIEQVIKNPSRAETMSNMIFHGDKEFVTRHHLEKHLRKELGEHMANQIMKALENE